MYTVSKYIDEDKNIPEKDGQDNYKDFTREKIIRSGTEISTEVFGSSLAKFLDWRYIPFNFEQNTICEKFKKEFLKRADKLDYFKDIIDKIQNIKNEDLFKELLKLHTTEKWRNIKKFLKKFLKQP